MSSSYVIPSEVLAQRPPINPALVAQKKQQGFAWVEPGGRIRVGVSPQRTKGARIIAIGPCRSMRNLFHVISRHGWEPGVFLVPGMPEAATPQDAEDALLDWLDWLASHERPDIDFVGAGQDKAGRSTSNERFARTVTMLSSPKES